MKIEPVSTNWVSSNFEEILLSDISIVDFE